MPGTRRGCGPVGHLGSDPETRSPVDFGFDEAVWSPRTADEVLWTMQSYFPNGDVTSRPYAGNTKITVEPQTIFSRKKGEKPEAVSVYDAEWKAGFDRKITGWATDFMQRSKDAGKPFYCYLPYTQVHNPSIPDPEYAGKTKHGNFADILTEMDDFTGVILDKLDELGLAEDTIVVWAWTTAGPGVPHPDDRPGPGGRHVERILRPVAGRPAHPSRGRTARPASSAGRGRCPQGGSATRSCTWWTGTRRCWASPARRCPTTA